MRTDIFGWFDKSEQTTPAHDPGIDAPCVVCGKKLERPVVTISLMADGDARSFFFRACKRCWNGIGEQEQNDIESSLIDELQSIL